MTVRHRNDTAHDDGEAAMTLWPGFVADAKALAGVIEEADDG